MFTVGIVLIVLASAFFFLRAVGTTQFVGVGAAATLLGCAMLVVAAGSLLPSVEDWFGARHELRTIQPLLDELGRRHPDVGIGVRPRGPLVFRVAERMSLISDALFLEATVADASRRRPGRCHRCVVEHRPGTRARARRPLRRRDAVGRARGTSARHRGLDLRWRGRSDEATRRSSFPGLGWLRQPTSYSDREWILAIAKQYRQLDRADAAARVLTDVGDYFAGCRVAAPRGLIVEVLHAAQLVNLLNDVLLRLSG